MKIFGIYILLIFFSLTACKNDQKDLKQPDGDTETIVDPGKELFDTHCLQCHSDISYTKKARITEVLDEMGEESFKDFLIDSDSLSNVAHRYEFSDEELKDLLEFIKK